MARNSIDTHFINAGSTRIPKLFDKPITSAVLIKCHKMSSHERLKTQVPAVLGYSVVSVSILYLQKYHFFPKILIIQFVLVVFHILHFVSPCQQIYSTMTIFDNSCMLRVCLNMVSCNEKAWFFNSIQKKLSLYVPKICIYKLTFITEFVIIIQSLTPSCVIITVKLAVHSKQYRIYISNVQLPATVVRQV